MSPFLTEQAELLGDYEASKKALDFARRIVSNLDEETEYRALPSARIVNGGLRISDKDIQSVLYPDYPIAVSEVLKQFPEATSTVADVEAEDYEIIYGQI